MKRVTPALMFVHRYLGAAFCLIFVVWFASGIVMVFKRMPEYSMRERLARFTGSRLATPLEPNSTWPRPAATSS